MEPIQVASKLRRQLAAERVELERLNAYYDGSQPLAYLHPDLLAELDNRVKQLVINWPRLVVDAVEERLDVEGFRVGADIDDTVWNWWQANNLDEESQMAHTDALVMRRAYTCVGVAEATPGVPLITVESPLQVITKQDPRTRQVVAAVKSYWDEDTDVEHTALYLPDATYHYRGGINGMVEDRNLRDEHGRGVVPITPLITRPRTLNKAGVSELADVVPLSDAANKIATDMMVAAEFHAIPRLVALGITEDDFVDEDGRPVSKWEKIAGRIWATPALPSEADVKQLPSADLRNFHDTINSLARLCAALSALPPHFFGWSDSNPASADGITAATMRLVKRVERRQRSYGGAWESTLRKAYQWLDVPLPDGATRIETVWRDAATPSWSQSADALTKFAAGLGVPQEALWERIPTVSTTEVGRWKEMKAADRDANANASAAAFGILGPDPLPEPVAEPVAGQ